MNMKLVDSSCKGKRGTPWTAQFLSLLVGLIVAAAFTTEVFAYGDDMGCGECHLKPPHSAENNISCQNCHGDRPFEEKLRGAELEAMCKNCHNPLGQAAGMSAVANHIVNGGATVVDCTYCHAPHAPHRTTNTHLGGKMDYNRKLIRFNTDKYVPQAISPTIFHEEPQHYAFEQSNPPWNGICQSCHTQTAYHTNDDTGDHQHHTGEDCTSCHSHQSGFSSGSECVVDLYDLSMFSQQWLQSGAVEANFDWQDNPQSENLVDLYDYSYLVSYWLNHCPDDWPW